MSLFTAWGHELFLSLRPEIGFSVFKQGSVKWSAAAASSFVVQTLLNGLFPFETAGGVSKTK